MVYQLMLCFQIEWSDVFLLCKINTSYQNYTDVILLLFDDLIKWKL